MRELVMKYFKGLGTLGSGNGPYEINYGQHSNVIHDLFEKHSPARTNLKFKYAYLKHCGIVYLDNIRKLPEYVPGRRQMFHRMKANGEVLPVELTLSLRYSILTIQ